MLPHVLLLCIWDLPVGHKSIFNLQYTAHHSALHHQTTCHRLQEAIMWNPSCLLLLFHALTINAVWPTERKGHHVHPLVLSINAHSPWTLRFLTDRQSTSGGVFALWNASLASSQLSRAHSRQQNTHKWEDDEMKGTVTLPMEGQFPRWNRCNSSMIPLFLKTHAPLSQQWRYNERLCIRSTAVCVSANQQRRLLLVTIAALTEALHTIVPCQPF